MMLISISASGRAHRYSIHTYELPDDGNGIYHEDPTCPRNYSGSDVSFRTLATVFVPEAANGIGLTFCLHR